MKLFLFSFFCFCFFVSCQKEYSLQNDGPGPSTVADFTFAGTPGACTAATIAGYYASATALTTDNTVTIQVNVAKTGTYSVATNLVNGYSFAATGSFTTTGVQTIILKGSGTPVAEGNDAFTPNAAGVAGCTFSNTVSAPAQAVYIMAGAPGACSNTTVNGIYGINVPLTNANTVSIQVNVSSIGTYTLTSNTVAGLTFSKSGTFAATGVQSVVLNGAGTPTTAGANVFTPQIGSSSCTFTVNVTGPAVYTMAGAPSACSNAVVNGTYELNKPLTAANTVTVQVNVTTIGSYTLSTNTVAGMTFSKSGSFTATGVQNVILDGSGTPGSSGDKIITPQAGSSSCTFTVTVAGPAVYTMAGAPGACTNATVNGTYTATTPLTSSNTVSVQINVTAKGAYTITSNIVGGMTFSKTGIFTTTGLQSIILDGNGTPTIAGANTLAITNSGCSFTVTVAAAPASTGVYQCKINGVLTTFTDRAHAETLDNFFNPPIPRLYLDGYTGPPNGSEVPELQIFIDKNDGSAITTGTYNVDGFASINGYRIEIDYHKVNADQSVTIWNTSSTLLTPNPPFTIIVTSVTANRVKGTFSGKLTDLLQGSTTIINITEGVFDLPIIN
jgi:hypothetical protein